MSDKIDYVKSGMSVLQGAGRRLLSSISLFLALISASPAVAGEECPGDADGNGQVVVSEMVRAVRNALDGCEFVPGCVGDVNCDGTVSVSELVQGVNSLLNGCPVADDLVVGVAWLRVNLGDPNLQVVDARVGGFPGGHIPGALPLNPYELAATVEGIPVQVIGASEAETLLSAVGLRSDATVVVYGDAPEFDPTRVVWALRYLGHPDVRYLDGGFSAWVGSGAVVAAGDPTRVAEPYTVQGVVEELRVTGAWVLENLGPAPYDSPLIQVVDARSAGEFADGHIPTALSRDWNLNIDSDTGLLFPLVELEQLYLQLDKSVTTVVYCTAGWRASVAWLVLTYLGFEDVRVYDGSWLEWGDTDRGFPIATP